MSRRPVVIDQFRDLPGTVEIVGLGDVHQPFGGAQEVEVAVLLATDRDISGFDADADTRVLWLGCGQLDLLVAGSLWSGGTYVDQVSASSITATFEFVRDERIGEGVSPQPFGARPFPSRAISAAWGFLLRQVAADGKEDRGRSGGKSPDLVLLPKMELLRALFGVSSGFLLELFDGIRDPAVSGERGLVSRDRSRLLDDGTVVLVTGRDLSRDEALIAAAVIADRDVRGLHDSAFQQLSVNSGWRDGLPTSLNLTWPWEMPITISLEGRWIERVGGGRRFIAMRMLAIGIPLPFTRVEVHHPGGEGRGHDDLPPSGSRMTSANAQIVVVTTGLAASPSRRPIEIATRTVDLSTASDIEVLSIARGGIARKDRGGIGEDPRDEARFGTGGRQSGAAVAVGSAATRRRRAGPQEVSARSQSQALDATWNALRLACGSAGWTLDAMPTPVRPSRDARHGGRDMPRGPLVARVGIDRECVLVVDRGSPAGAECSLGILIPLQAGMDDQALAEAAHAACTDRAGRWRSKKVSLIHPIVFHIIAINRGGEVWQDADVYARMLRRRIASAWAARRPSPPSATSMGPPAVAHSPCAGK